MKTKLTLPVLFGLFLLLHCQSEITGTNGHLIIIGGGPRPAGIMRKFIELAGDSIAKIAVIPMASEIFRVKGPKYEKEFLELGVKTASSFYITNRSQANEDSIINTLNEYTGFFFGGGNQNRLTEIFLNTRSLKLLQKKYRNGAVIGSTSAGASFMSQIMITGKGD